MRNVHLYGHLKAAFGPVFRLDVDTPAKAIRLLNVNFPGFERALRKGYYRLIVGRRNGGEAIDLADIDMRLGGKDFHIVPVLGGAKRGGVLKAVLGVALVGAAIFFSGGTLAAPLGGLMGAGGSLTFAGNVAMFGVMTTLAGVSQMISPQAKSDVGTRKEDSYALSGPTNLGGQGFPVPLCIGRVLAPGIPVSTGYDVEDIAIGA